MAIILRSEKGAPLSPDEVDGNFTYLKALVDAFTAPAGVGIVSISVAGDKMTIHLSDGSTRGPFQLPTTTTKWRDGYVPGFSFHALDAFSIDGDGVYLVMADHVAPDVFDPGYVADGAAAYLKIFGFEVTPNSAVPVINYTDTHTLGSADAGGWVRMDAPGPVDVVVPFNEADPLPVGFTCAIRWVGAGAVTVSPGDLPTDAIGLGTDTPVLVINTPETYDLRKQGSTATLVKVDTNEWDLSGDIEAA